MMGVTNEGKIRKIVDFKILFPHRRKKIEENHEPAVSIQDCLNTVSFARPQCPSYKAKTLYSRKY
jgi:hypothetical protein